MPKEPGSEDEETQGTVRPGSGRMEHLGTTPTGPHHSQMISRVRRTVVASIRLIAMDDGMIKNAALIQPLFARKVKIIQFNNIR